MDASLASVVNIISCDKSGRAIIGGLQSAFLKAWNDFSSTSDQTNGTFVLSKQYWVTNVSVILDITAKIVYETEKRS